MKGALILAAAMTASLLSTSAEAQFNCRAVATCDAALKTCNARKSAAMTAAPNCEAAAAECRKTGVWRGVSDRGPYECLMPSR